MPDKAQYVSSSNQIEFRIVYETTTMYLTTPIYLEVCDRVTTPASIINSALNVPYVSDVLERVVHVNEVGA